MKELIRYSKAIVATALSLLAGSAFAGSEDLHITNVISSSVASYTSYPTNQIGTNGLPQATGLPVHVYLQKGFGFQLTGTTVNWTNAAAKHIGIQLITSMANNSPTVVSNSPIDIRNDWNTPDNVQLAWIVASVTTTNGAFNFETNFSNTTVGSEANWVGVYQITNDFTATCALSNSVAVINKKITPVGLVGLPAQ